MLTCCREGACLLTGGSNPESCSVTTGMLCAYDTSIMYNVWQKPSKHDWNRSDNMKYSTVLSLTIAMLIAASSVSAAKKSKFYKWTDENGVVHYTQEPPPEQVQADELTVQDLGPASIDTAAEEDASDDESESSSIDSVNDRLAAEAEKFREQAAVLEERQKQVRNLNCQEGRARIAALEPRQQVLIQLPDGSERMVSGQERINELEKARKMVADNCD